MKRACCRLGRSLLLVTFPTLTAAAGCADKEHLMAASGRTPAAEGTVMTQKGENGDTVAHVRVKHLAPPYRLASDATTYIVWAQPVEAPIQNVGIMKLNQDLVGELDFVTPHRAFRVTVTPESAPTLTAPLNRPVFAASVDARD